MGLYADRFFPWFMDKVMDRPHVALQRLAALEGLEGEVLEIGVGTGLNLAHYPEAVRSVTGLDPSEAMLRRARKKAEVSARRVRLVRDDAEALPFEDHRFDAVVSTWTLCTIHDAGQALLEVRRVLKPEGRFVFLEHGQASSDWDRRLQDWLNPLQRRLACGCNLNRDIPGLITGAGFRIVHLHRYVMPKTPKPLTFMAHLFRGLATL